MQTHVTRYTLPHVLSPKILCVIGLGISHSDFRFTLSHKRSAQLTNIDTHKSCVKNHRIHATSNRKIGTLAHASSDLSRHD